MRLTKLFAIALTSILLLTAASSSWATYKMVNGQWVYVDNDSSSSYDNDNGREDSDNDNDNGREDNDNDNDNGSDNDND